MLKKYTVNYAFLLFMLRTKSCIVATTNAPGPNCSLIDYSATRKLQNLHCQGAVVYCVFCSECFEKYNRQTHLNLSTLKCRLTRQISVYGVLSKAKFDYKKCVCLLRASNAFEV